MQQRIIAFLVGILLGVYGCAGKKKAHHEDNWSGVVFSYYEDSEKPQPKNHLLLLLAPMNITFSTNVPLDMQRDFKASMQNQIQSILEKRGFSVESVEGPLSPKQEKNGYAIVKVSGDIHVLEELDMRIFRQRKDKIGKQNVNLSMGFLELKLIEPKSKKVLQMTDLELPGYQIKTDVTIQQRRTTSGGGLYAYQHCYTRAWQRF